MVLGAHLYHRTGETEAGESLQVLSQTLGYIEKPQNLRRSKMKRKKGREGGEEVGEEGGDEGGRRERRREGGGRGGGRGGRKGEEVGGEERGEEEGEEGRTERGVSSEQAAWSKENLHTHSFCENKRYNVNQQTISTKAVHRGVKCPNSQ